MAANSANTQIHAGALNETVLLFLSNLSLSLLVRGQDAQTWLRRSPPATAPKNRYRLLRLKAFNPEAFLIHLLKRINCVKSIYAAPCHFPHLFMHYSTTYKNTVLLFAILMAFLSGCSSVLEEQTTAEPEGLFYEGKAGENKTIVMALEQQNENLKGVYLDEETGQTMNIKGRIVSDDEVELTAYTQSGQEAGKFKGSWQEKELSGSWTMAGAASSTPFSLKKIPAQQVQHGYYLFNHIVSENTDYYNITAQYPEVLALTNDAERKQVNGLIKEYVQELIADFRDSNADDTTDYEEIPPSEMTVSYVEVSKSPQLVSVRFEVMEYDRGAAHPAQYYHTINYDFERGQMVKVEDLFADSSYREPIIKMINKKLAKLDKGMPCMVTPEQEALQNVSIETDGLLFAFDNYMLGAYACGTPVVKVPYNKIQQYIRPEYKNLFEQAVQ